MSRIATQLIRYYSVGALAVLVDFGLFQTLLMIHATAVLAAALSSPIAAALHFTLNRTWSFQAYHRSVPSQAAAYIIVYAFIWVVTVAVVAYGTGVLGLTPWQAKIAAIIVTLPIGFLGHKYFTYGTGIISRGARDER